MCCACVCLVRVRVRACEARERSFDLRSGLCLCGAFTRLCDARALTLIIHTGVSVSKDAGQDHTPRMKLISRSAA